MRITGITYVPKRSHKVRNTILLLFVIVLIAASALMFITTYTILKLTHPPKAGIPTFSANIVPDYQSVSFTGKDTNVTLKGWYFKSKDSEKTVIFVHGYGQNRLPFKEQTLDLIKALLNKGYNVLTFDLRNSGESGGKATTLGYYEKDDIAAAVKYVKSHSPGKIVLMGFSTGGAACILSAAENPDIAAVIADSPYSDLKQYISEGLTSQTPLPPIPFNKSVFFCLKEFYHIDFDKASPINVVSRMAPRQLLLIHSKDDTNIPSNNSEQIFKTYSKISANSVELWETQGTDHLGSYEKFHQEYLDRVLNFLDKVTAKK